MTATDTTPGSLGRRAFLGGLGAAAGLLVTGGSTGLPRWLGGRPFDHLDHEACLARLDASLTPAQRAFTVHPWEHPTRQVTNTVAVFRTPHIGTLFDAEQRALIDRLYETMVSDQGRAWLNNTITLEGRLEGCVLAIFSDRPAGSLAGHDRTQTMISGGHVLLREGGTAASGYAFGGPLAYGQQIGNGAYRVEGNAFAVHSDAANAFYASLSDTEQASAREPSPPNELMVQPQGPDVTFTGVRIGDVSPASREKAEALVDTVLATYKPEARSDARAALDENGGIDALHVTVYEDRGFYPDGARYAELSEAERAAREPAYWQVWRIEGPGCVVHFKGSPHVHAYIDIVRDPRRQNVGEVLTRNTSPIGQRGVRDLLQAALRHETSEAAAWYPAEVPGRVCAGDVTTGLVHALDPFDEKIVVAQVRGAAMQPDVRTQVTRQLGSVDDAKTYRVASVSYPVGRADRFGEAEQVDPWPRPMREALAAYLRDRDLGGFNG